MLQRPGGSEGDGSPAAELERRAFVRYGTELEVTGCSAGSLKRAGWPARVVNLSLGGVGLLLRHRFEIGSPLAIELQNRAGTGRRTVLARVAHATAVRDQGQPCWLTGCAFTTPLAEAELRTFL